MKLVDDGLRRDSGSCKLRIAHSSYLLVSADEALQAGSRYSASEEGEPSTVDVVEAWLGGTPRVEGLVTIYLVDKAGELPPYKEIGRRSATETNPH